VTALQAAQDSSATSTAIGIIQHCKKVYPCKVTQILRSATFACYPLRSQQNSLRNRRLHTAKQNLYPK
jgi:hypothetical protein